MKYLFGVLLALSICSLSFAECYTVWVDGKATMYCCNGNQCNGWRM